MEVEAIEFHRICYSLCSKQLFKIIQALDASWRVRSDSQTTGLSLLVADNLIAEGD